MSLQEPERRRYIVMPDYGYRGRAINQGVLATTNGAIRVQRHPGADLEEVRVLEAISDGGPRLVEASVRGELALQAEFGSSVRIIPMVYYDRPTPVPRLRDRQSEPGKFYRASRGLSATTNAVEVTVKDRDNGRPVPNVLLVAFTNYRHREGVEMRTDAFGRGDLPLPAGTKIERLYVFPEHGHWGHYRASFELPGNLDLMLKPIHLDDPLHTIPRLYSKLPETSGEGVTVGIIDTGVDPGHADLSVDFGRNMVFDEISADAEAHSEWGDIDQHGTHVAGIVAARGKLRGLAPRARIHAYRVFPKGDQGASNFDIMHAIDYAVRDGCHIINLSLGGEAMDDGVRGALTDAVSKGVVVCAAAGNGGRRAVSFPAANPGAIAVSAIGLRDGFPADSSELADVSKPASTQYPNVFLSAFTNIGPQIRLTGPGVGIASTVPGGYAVMSGTSMAAPAVAGFAAYLLSQNQEILAMPGDGARSEALTKLLFQSAVPLGLGRYNEGSGLPLQPGHNSSGLLGSLPMG